MSPQAAAATVAGPGALRFSGTLEAVRSRSIPAPRMSGSYAPMTITMLAKPGTRAKAGDLVLEFDPQDQLRAASDKRAELVDLDSQIERKRADQAAANEKDRTALVAAQNDIERAKLAVSTNDLIARVAAEKNSLTLQQNVAKLEQLQATAALKREAADADMKILEIRRERTARALRYAEENSTKMQVRAPFAGLVVVKTMYKQGSQGQVEILEGDSVRPGMAIIDLVDTSAMQVRARVNQADAEIVKAGMPATVRLDGFPDLSFKGRVEQVTPLATPGVGDTVRMFVALVSIEGSHPQLLPDLTASVEVTPAPKGKQ
ncbi:MAG TPA: efflux RND transporter periplasmic adaptor subunit [Vicinamibacterales bacterium]|nr:efflux RND transporter periplasmic adaptor subunit [Vicinamibacterales bacterium]